jgi:crotonobetainyl-CoA:carnitine CoA-transferase CaiB-like acyl-CoA transferase
VLGASELLRRFVLAIETPLGDGEMLKGVRIVDLTSVLFGPYCTQILADLGADVIKIEAKQGDVLRLAGNAAVNADMGPCHLTLNRGKRSLVLDLKDPADAAVFRDLLETADVFVHNVRAKAIERLGFGYEQVCAFRPDILYVHCVGYGSGGVYDGLKAFDDTVQAASGITSLAVMTKSSAEPRYIATAMADKVGGLHAVYAILAGMVHRLRTGRGQHIEVPMFEAFTHFFLQEHLCNAALDPASGPIGYPRQLDPERRPMPTLNGFVALAPYIDAEYAKLLVILDGGYLLDDPAYATPAARRANQTRLFAELAKLTESLSTEDILRRCEEAQIAAMPVTALEDIFDNPHLRSVDFFTTEQHPTEGRVVRMAPPVRFGDFAYGAQRPAPRLGEHNDEIKQELEGSVPDVSRKAI